MRVRSGVRALERPVTRHQVLAKALPVLEGPAGGEVNRIKHLGVPLRMVTATH